MKKIISRTLFSLSILGFTSSAFAIFVDQQELIDACEASVKAFGEKTIEFPFVDVAGKTVVAKAIFRATPYEEHGCTNDNSRFFMGFTDKGKFPAEFWAIFEAVQQDSSFVFKLAGMKSNCVEATTEPFIGLYKSRGFTITAQIENVLRKVVSNSYCPAKTEALKCDLLKTYCEIH